MNNALKEIIDIEMNFVSGINNTNFLIFFILFIGIFVLYIYKYKIESFMLILTGGSFLFSTILKNIFRESRPLTAQNYMFLEKYSFPSSHTVTYTVIFGYILYLTYKISKKNKFITSFIRVLCIYFIALVGVSRVYLGQHYMRDVIAGYGFGCLYLAVILLLEKRLDQGAKLLNTELKNIKPTTKDKNHHK